MQESTVMKSLINWLNRQRCQIYPALPPFMLQLNKQIFQFLSEIKSIIKNLVYVYGTRFISHLLQEDIGLSYKHFFPSIFTLSSSSSPINFRLRIGHCKLNSHLHKINLHSPKATLSLARRALEPVGIFCMAGSCPLHS